MPMVVALARSTHPGPALAVTLTAIVLGVCAALDPWRVVLLGAAILFDQLSVGLSNDWLDADRDRASARVDKPVALGLVSVRSARTAALATAVLALALTVPLGWRALLVHAVMLGSAWSYNAWAKRSPFSVAPFLLSFGLLPLLATLSRSDPRPATWWVLGAGALLGVGAHFSNVLPDLADDAATGVRGLPHRMGPVATGTTLALALVGASALVALGPGITVPGAIGLAASAAFSIATAILVLRGHRSRWLFRLIIAAALIDVALLALAGSEIIA